MENGMEKIQRKIQRKYQFTWPDTHMLAWNHVLLLNSTSLLAMTCPLAILLSLLECGRFLHVIVQREADSEQPQAKIRLEFLRSSNIIIN